ncbi:lysoplasmalogenase [Lutibacter sp.]|uniref:lysoplasmalogenase n=1 Tax=Lutibacter sp. TaxID=1925666 RepID=UPI001A180217|nr:lysoplasmalogenase [Lutibacter sp.]MBI9042050.1 lysoplasmalogenase [Lutibacter sp.]
MNKTKIAFLFFVFVSLLDIVGIIFKIPILVYVFKPLIIFSLIFLYVFSLPKRLKWYVIALELSFFGDVLLLFEGELFFIFGLISFLFAHLLFIKIVIDRIKKITLKSVLVPSIPFLVVFGLLIFTLKDSLNELLIPVIIYGLVISIFGTVSFLDFLKTKSKLSLLMLIGAVIFIISDATLAINKFYSPSHFFEILVMATYVLAQYFIFRSMVLVKK